MVDIKQRQGRKSPLKHGKALKTVRKNHAADRKVLQTRIRQKKHQLQRYHIIFVTISKFSVNIYTFWFHISFLYKLSIGYCKNCYLLIYV